MDIHGHPQTPTNTHRHSWTSMDIHGHPWTWTTMEPHRIPLISTKVGGIPLSLVKFHGAWSIIPCVHKSQVTDNCASQPIQPIQFLAVSNSIGSQCFVVFGSEQSEQGGGD